MNREQVKILFEKYVRNQCSPDEIELLQTYLESFQDNKNLWAELNYDKEIKNKIWSQISSATAHNKRKSKYSLNKKYLQYAAIFVLLIGSIVWFKFAESKVEIETISIADDPIVLKTSDNKIIKINSEGEQIVLNKSGKVVGQQNGNQLSYDNDEGIKELVYNEISIPNGKRFKLILSDGSLVHINSGSSLKYPVNFIKGKERKVFLKGEAYFEVTKDEENPFLVAAEKIEVKVLGTNFNVSSYQDSDTFAVLAEGSVAVYDKKSNDSDFRTIEPGEKAMINENAIEVTEVDLNHYLGWRDGLLAFNNEQFVNIIKNIERYYGVTIQNEFSALGPARFRGFFKDETITDLLDTFQESAGFEYSIANKKIIITSLTK